jgi:hypothetical protein
MVTATRSRPDLRSLQSAREEETAQQRKEPRIADIWQDALAKQDHFDACKAAVEELRTQLDTVCLDIIENGNNGEKIYQTRMLEVSLRHARRQLELAHKQLDASIRHLRRVHADQRSDEGLGTPFRNGGGSI